MYSAIATGRNLNYGEQGERILIGDTFVKYALKSGWIEDVKKDGSGRLVIRDIKTGKELR
jgi:RecB family exonuclease